MNKKNFVILLILVVIILLVAGLTYFIRSESIKEAQNEAKKTLFSTDVEAQFLDAGNNPLSLSVYQDKILVVNVWASWSPYTAVEFPILNEVASSYKDKGVHFLVMNRKENQSQIERYLATIPRYDNLEQITDVNDFFYAGVDGYAMPETVIYNSDGKIIKHIRGVVVQAELEAILNEILAEQN